MANIGKNIKQFRLKKNLTQDQLAEQLFVSRQTISNYENNKSNPDIDMLIKIAGVLETDVNTLIYGAAEIVNRKKQVIRELVLTLIVILLGIAVRQGNDFLIEIKKHYFTVFPLISFTLIIKTAYFILLGWYGMELLFFFMKVQPIKNQLRKKIRFGVMIVLALYIIFIAPYIIWQIQYYLVYEIHGHNYANTYYGTFDFWGIVSAWLLLEAIYVRGYVLFVIPGIFLRICSSDKQTLK